MFFTVTIKGKQNIKFYGGETITVLNPCHVSIFTTQYLIWSNVLLLVKYIDCW